MPGQATPPHLEYLGTLPCDGKPSFARLAHAYLIKKLQPAAARQAHTKPNHTASSAANTPRLQQLHSTKKPRSQACRLSHCAATPNTVSNTGQFMAGEFGCSRRTTEKNLQTSRFTMGAGTSASVSGTLPNADPSIGPIEMTSTTVLDLESRRSSNERSRYQQAALWQQRPHPVSSCSARVGDPSPNSNVRHNGVTHAEAASKSASVPECELLTSVSTFHPIYPRFMPKRVRRKFEKPPSLLSFIDKTAFGIAFEKALRQLEASGSITKELIPELWVLFVTVRAQRPHTLVS
jgi:hypothetical protein